MKTDMVTTPTAPTSFESRTTEPSLGLKKTFLTGWRLDLFERFPKLHWLVTRRWFQFAVILPNLLFFYVFLISGVFGSPVGNRNIIIIFIWILWWFALITALVPFASRVWCTVCPLPFFGDWIQRRTLIAVRPGRTAGLRNQFFGLNKKWPKALSNIWLQNITFLALCTFSAMLVTRPIVTVWVLGGLIVVAAAMALIWRGRTFCNYACPISGFLSLFSMTSTLALRSRDLDVCAKCTSKACATGSDKGWACPWGVYMGKLDRNNYCGLCMECVKSCPNGNIGLFLRPAMSDTRIKGYDESWKAFIMLTLAAAYSIVLLGPYGTIKDFANIAEVGDWRGFGLYVGALWLTALVGLPAVFAGCVWLGRRISRADIGQKEAFLGLSYVLVPLGLLAWIAFSFPLIMVNGSYILNVASDPMGRGWDLFGTSLLHWNPILPEYVALIQVPLLLLGAFYAIRAGFRFSLDNTAGASRAVTLCAPVSIFVVAMTWGFLRLFVG